MTLILNCAILKYYANCLLASKSMQKGGLMSYRHEYDLRVIGKNLKKYRLANGLSVEEVKEYMHLGTTHAIYKWERGDGLPQADSLMALMELYGIDRMSKITEGSIMLPSSLFMWKLCNFALTDKATSIC